MFGRIFSTNVSESVVKEIMESEVSELFDLIDVADCLAMGCLVFIFLASAGLVMKINDRIMKLNQSMRWNAQGMRLLLPCLSWNNIGEIILGVFIVFLVCGGESHCGRILDRP